MTRPRILVACIGNIFLGDDGFGVEVGRRLAHRHIPDGARVVDYGIRGLDLVYALMDDYDAVILVDAIPRGGDPGAVYVIEPDLDELGVEDRRAMAVEPHGMNPMKVLQMARSMGAQFKRILLVGCEPETLGPEEGQMGLSAPVEAAVDEAVSVIESLVNEILDERYGLAASQRH
jgi:hydrogenase maturation protease